MNSKKALAVFISAIFLVSSAAALSIEIDLIDLGGSGDDASNSTSNQTEDSGDDQRFTYGGEESDQITDKEGVKKSIMEQIVGAVINTLFG